MREIIVIGGGIIGSSVAYRLACSGAKVTLIEENTLGSGTSRTSFAWINANNKAPLEYHRLNVGGMAEHNLLRDEFGSAPWLHVHGNVIWESGARDPAIGEPNVPVLGETLGAKIQRLREWSYPVEMLSPAELSAIHPDLLPPSDVTSVAYFPTEGYIDVPLLIATLIRAAKNLNAEILTGKKVVDIIQEAGRIAGVRTADGDHIAADMVVSCSGRWTDEVTALTGVTIPMAPTLGLLVASSPAVVGLQSLAHTPKVNVRPDGGSRILMASFEIDSLLELDSSKEYLCDFAQQILERATTILPALKGSVVETLKLGVRAIPSDSFPVIGPITGLDGFYTIGTHSGVTMGPLLGRIAMKEILAGETDGRVATFRPDRLISAEATHV